MLTIQIHNVTQPRNDKDSNYTYDVYVNQDVIASGMVFGHDRSEGWINLVEMVLDHEKRIFNMKVMEAIKKGFRIETGDTGEINND
jgi:hypothetical protein